MFSKAVSIVALVLLALPAAAAGAQSPPEGPHVVVCPIEGMIDEGVSVLVKRAVRDAENATAIVFVIDTFGGRVDSAVDIASAITEAKCPTVAYIVGKGAISAGALIAYSCDEIVMKPATNFGAAQPVYETAEGMMPTGEKELSFVRNKMRALAEENGHNPDIAEAMVDARVVLRARPANDKLDVYKSTAPEDAAKGSDVEAAVQEFLKVLGPNASEEVRQAAESFVKSHAPAPAAAPSTPNAADEQDRIVLAQGQLLTLTPKEALLYGVIPTTSRSLDEVIKYFKFDDVPRYQVAMTLGETIFRFLTNPMVSWILLMLGIGGIYLEIKTPGVSLPGIVGVTCLALFLGAHYVIGLADALDIILIVVGVALLLAEIFVIPGFGVVGVSGIVCIFVGLYLSLTKVGIPEYSWDYDRLTEALTTLGIAFGGLALFVALVIRILPDTPIYRRLVLSDAQYSEAGYTVQTTRDQMETVGLVGVAATVLRPAGRGRFDGKTFNVVSRAEYIDEGTPIVIVEVDGNRYVVDRTEARA